jgi:hypothetical protein
LAFQEFLWYLLRPPLWCSFNERSAWLEIRMKFMKKSGIQPGDSQILKQTDEAHNRG